MTTRLDQLLALVGEPVTATLESTSPPDLWADWIGCPVIIRTVTMMLTGRLVAVDPSTLALEDAAWVADSGRWADALSSGQLSEVEPFPAGRVLVGRGAVVDAALWGHALPRVQV